MRATLLATLLVICILTLAHARQSPPPAPTPSKTSQKQQHEGSSKPKSADSNYTNPQPSATPANTFSPLCCVVTSNGTDNASKKSATDWITVFTAVLAVVAVLQWWMICRQAAYFRCSERTWVAGLPLSFSPELQPTWEPEDPIVASDKRGAYHHIFNTSIKNVGKTVAQIDKTAIRYVYVEESLSKLPEVPDYGKGTHHDGYLLIPNGEIWIYTLLTALAVNRLEAAQGVESGLLNRRQIANIEKGQDFLYAYGEVKYRDIFRKRRRTRFGYVYHFPKPNELGDGKPRFQPGGPRAYNDAD